MNRMFPIARQGISRRGFLVALGATGLTVAFGGLPRRASGATLATDFGRGLRPNVWVTIGTDGAVTLVSPSAEMGQGVLTASPLLIAEDLDADWNRVRVAQAPADMAYGNPEFGGVQLTGGSATTPGYYTLLRLTGAETRLVLIASAAQMLGVPAAELRTEPHRVIHDMSDRSLDYGEIAAVGTLPDPLPEATEVDLKPASQFRYIGSTSIPRIDVPAKVDGSAVYGIDVELPDMLYGGVLRAPVQDEGPDTIDEAAARAVPGVLSIVALPYGVGIIAESYDAVRRAKDLLSVTWTESARARGYSSGAILENYRGIARDLSLDGGIDQDQGDAPAAIGNAEQVIESDYLTDHVYHATMEPMTATARITGDGVEIWAPTQAQSLTTWVAAGILGIDPDNVTLTTTLLGGGLGRKAEGDFISDAVLLAREVEARPVKVIWTREDDVRHGKYRPLVAQHVQVGLDQAGDIIGWRHRLVADSIYARWYPEAFAESGGMDDTVYGGLENNYALAAHRTEYLRRDSGQDVGFWRSTAEGYTKFGVEGMMDEVANVAGRDPLEFRLDHLDHDPRAQAVLRTAAEMARWDNPRSEGRALGIVYSHAWGAHCAQVAEVSLDRESGAITVHQVWCAVDPGIAIQPVNIEAQMMSGIVHGVSAALYEQINIVNGEVQESNFDNYRVLRMSETPEVHVRVLPTDNPPSGIGEVGLPPVAPAIANAVARLTGGVRLRHLPFLPERVLAALGD